MTAIYEKRGLKFMYPENWKLEDTPAADLPCSISLEAPDGSAFWALHLHPADADPDEVLKETLMALEETYPDMEINTVEPDFESWPGTGLEALFYCLDFLVRVRLQVIETEAYQMLFWFQAEDREFDKQELVFQAIATSVLSAA